MRLSSRTGGSDMTDVSYRCAAWLVFALVAAMALAPPAAAERRLALVIGNSAYIHAPTLANPENDAALMGRLLRELNFDVIGGSNLDYAKMDEVIRQFARDLEQAGPDAVGLFYYAGHGIQIRDLNYLIPVDAVLKSEIDAKVATIGLNWILDILAASRSRASIVILDACRNNPFQIGTANTRSTARGLARVEAATGMLVSYSTAPGHTAEDGAGGNSPFTKALGDTVQQPGLMVEQVFKSVRVKVHEATGGRQIPWESTSLTVDFYFKPGAEPEPGAKSDPAVAAVSGGTGGDRPGAPAATGAPNSHAGEDDQIAFYRALEQNTLDGYEEFLRTRRDHPKAGDVRKIVLSYSDEQAWLRASKENTKPAYQRYLIAFPNGSFVSEASNRIAAPTGPVTPPGATSPPLNAAPATNGAATVDCGAPHGSYRVVGVGANDVLNIRTGPGAQNPVAGVIPHDGAGIGVATCDAAREWCRVDYGCSSGWVASRFLAAGAEASSNSSAAGRYRVVDVASNDVLNIRRMPDGDAGIVGVIPYNADNVVVRGCRDLRRYQYKWCYVSFGGSEGWVYGRHLAHVANNARP